MNTIIRVAKDARFFSNLSNARRALKKVLDVDTATANSFIHQEALEEGGRFWYSESAVAGAAEALVKADNETVIQVTTPVQPVASVASPAPVASTAAASKSRSEVRNGVRKPIKGKCAEVWATLTALQEVTESGAPVNIADVRKLAETHNWNLNNATIEFYAWRKFHKDAN